MECETYNHKNLQGYREKFDYPQYDQLDAGNIDNMNNGGNEVEWAINSFFGRTNYNYMDRYLLEANIRSRTATRALTFIVCDQAHASSECSLRPQRM